MRRKLTKRTVEAVAPGARDLFVWDTELPGFGVKVTPHGGRIYVLQYSRDGRDRRVTIGRHGIDVTVEQARGEAEILRGLIRTGRDPAAERASARAMPTLAELSTAWLTDYAKPKKKASSIVEDRRLLDKHLLPKLGHLKVSTLTRADVERLQRSVSVRKQPRRRSATGKETIEQPTPIRANRCLALLSTMLNFAERKGLLPPGANPCRHVERFPERKRSRFLSEAELARLGAVLAEAERLAEHPSVIAALRLLIFTGCRLGEILTLQWDDVDTERGCLRLRDSKSGPRSVTLGAPALAVLASLPPLEGNPYVLPGARAGGHYVALQKAWRRLRAEAGLEDVRIHDLRHSFASVGAGSGESLLIIGRLLGHSQASTTERYAHLADDPMKAAADRISERIAAAMQGSKAEVVALPRRSK
jgi:integrase